MGTTTLFEKRQQRKAAVNARRDAGICIDCGDKEPGWNLDGKRSVRCDACKDRSQSSRTTLRSRFADQVTFDVEDEDYRDTRAFKAYVKAIERLFAKHEALTTRLIHEDIGYERQAWTLTAIGFIDGVEEVGILPTRYQLYPADRRKPLPWTMRPSVGHPADRTVPMTSSYAFERRVTA